MIFYLNRHLTWFSVTSASRYITSASRFHPHYQRRSSMYIRGMIPWNFAELAAVVPIGDVLMCRLESGLYCKLVKFL